MDRLTLLHSLTSKTFWQSLEFTHQDFKTLYRGHLMTSALVDAIQIGFMLADKKPSSFQVAIRKMCKQFYPSNSHRGYPSCLKEMKFTLPILLHKDD
jgi:hypothetical protein